MLQLPGAKGVPVECQEAGTGCYVVTAGVVRADGEVPEQRRNGILKIKFSGTFTTMDGLG